MRIAEIYHSVQGEGQLTGTPSTFVRTSGCNLRCWYCDTPYTSWNPVGDDLSLRAIRDEVGRLDCPHVVITGGEPMLFAELIPLSEQLRADGRHITIETAGTLYLPVVCDLMSISPKTANSTPTVEVAPQWAERHERTRWAPRIIQRLIQEYAFQLKFVIDHQRDLVEIRQTLAHFPLVDPQQVWLMPQGVTSEELDEKNVWLESYCTEHGFRFSPRRHIEWFGNVRGT